MHTRDLLKLLLPTHLISWTKLASEKINKQIVSKVSKMESAQEFLLKGIAAKQNAPISYEETCNG